MSLVPDRISPFTQAQFSETYGGSLICAFISLPLYGISLLQTYIYFLDYPRDNVWMKAMVLGLVALESLHQWATCNTVYHYSILSYSNPLSLIKGEWSVYLASVIGTVIAFIIEMYFVYMVYFMVQKKWRIPLLTLYSLFILGQLGFGLYVVVMMYRIWDLPGLYVIVYPGLVPMYVLRVGVDALTTICLCVVLHKSARRSSRFEGSVKLFRTLIIYSMNRFILTTLVVILQTVVLLVRPKSIWAMVMDFITAHLYINSFLAMLNARTRLRKIGQISGVTSSMDTMGRSVGATKTDAGHFTTAQTQSGMAFAPNERMDQTKSKHSININMDDSTDEDDIDRRHGVKVHTETYVLSDMERKHGRGAV